MSDLYELTRFAVGMSLYAASDFWHKLGVRPLSDLYDALGNRAMG